MDDFTSRTADHMLDYLGSNGDPGWVFFRQFGEWECLYNLENDRKFVSRLARNLEERGLIEVRRIAEGTQLRMTDSGRQQAGQRQREDEENANAKFHRQAVANGTSHTSRTCCVIRSTSECWPTVDDRPDCITALVPMAT